MNQSLSPISDSRNESVEVSRRLYRCMMETARQLDDYRSNAKSPRDLFAVQAELLRLKLREYAERLIFSNSLGQGRKVQEVLWRKGFYEDVSTAKRLRKNHQWLPEEKAQLHTHLTSGVGFYHHLLLRLQVEVGLNLASCADFPLLRPDQEYGKSKVQPSSKQVESIKESCHRCLICLGDLSRYLLDLSPCWDSGIAVRYYHQALSWNPDIGMPHNQLGTLSASVNCSLDAVYHYMRCIMCSQPFEGAEGNLKRIMERNSLRLSEVAVESGLSIWQCCCVEPGSAQLSDAQDNILQFISHFLLLVDVWFFDKKPVPNISELCHQTLLDLHQCLGYSELIAIDDNEDNINPKFPLYRKVENFPSHLSKDMVFKIVVLTIMCLSKLRSKGSDQSSSVVAFLLAVFTLLVQQVQEHLQDSVLNLSLPTGDKLDEIVVTSNGDLNHNSPEAEENTNDVTNSIETCLTIKDASLDVVKNGETKRERKLKKLTKITRRRHRESSHSEESEHSENEASHESTASDISEDEEVVLDVSSDDDDDDEKDFAVEDVEDDVVVLEEAEETVHGPESSGLTNGETNGSGKTLLCTESKAHYKVSEPADMLEQVTGEDLLPAIKVCTDWLLGDTSVVQACGKDSRDMLRNFIQLVNVINIDIAQLEKSPDASSVLKNRSLMDIAHEIPLPEDVLLQKLVLLHKAHENLRWDLIHHHYLNSKEEALLRVKKLVLFCQLLVTIPDTGVKYCDESHTFSIAKRSELNVVPLNGISKGASSGIPNGTSSKTMNGIVHGCASVSPVDSDADSKRRGQLMQNMGQLWLRAEVQNLECSVKRDSKGESFSPYLVLDVDALTKHYQLVGQLMSCRKFIMIVPSVVLTALDQLKRESSLARDAIRWLEYQFKRGSRFLRAQTPAEALHLPLVSYPKQKAREAWTYFKVLECCHYLNQQSTMSRSSDRDAALVTLLTGHSWGDTNEFSPIGIAKAVGVTIEHIESFYLKWKTSTKSHG